MKVRDKPIILEAEADVEYKQVSGWVTKDGYFFGEDEERARLHTATHKKCLRDSTHPIFTKNSYCQVCYQLARDAKYESMEVVEWDGESYLTVFDDDKFFRDYETLNDYAEELGVAVDDLKLIICEKVGIPQIDVAIWDDLVEEYDMIPSEILYALEHLNQIIEDHGSDVMWQQGNKRVVFNNYLSGAQ